MLVVGVQLAGAAQLHQLLEVAHRARHAAFAFILAGLDRARQRVELHLVALDVLGVGQYPPDALLEYRLQFGFPIAHIGLRGGDADFAVADRHRQHPGAYRVGVGDDLGDGVHVYAQRVDAQIGQVGFLGQPLHQRFERELAALVIAIGPFARGNHFQRMALVTAHRRLRRGGLGHVLGDQAVGQQHLEQLCQRQLMVVAVFGFHGCEVIIAIDVVAVQGCSAAPGNDAVSRNFKEWRA